MPEHLRMSLEKNFNFCRIQDDVFAVIVAFTTGSGVWTVDLFWSVRQGSCDEQLCDAICFNTGKKKREGPSDIDTHLIHLKWWAGGFALALQVIWTFSRPMYQSPSYPTTEISGATTERRKSYKDHYNNANIRLHKIEQYYQYIPSTSHILLWWFKSYFCYDALMIILL